MAVAQQGKKSDSLDESIKGSVQGNTATVQFQSSFTKDAGTARITFVDANTISWKVTVRPDGEYYLPNEATLTKKSPAANPSPAKTGPVSSQTNPEATRIQFQPNATSWQTSGDLAPNASIRFVLRALKGQPMDVELTVPDADAGPSASVTIWGQDGQNLTPDLTTRWKGVLTASQDYTIEIRSLSQQPINYSLLVAIPAIGSTPYVPITPEVCQTLQELATQALGIAFTMEASAPFTDPVTGETGQGCTLTATGTGRDFSNPHEVTAKLVSAFGFTEQPTYQADGPTGTATGATRDMALALLRAEWAPAPEVQCPSDKPISECDLKPEQKLYTIQVQAAMK